MSNQDASALPSISSLTTSLLSKLSQIQPQVQAQLQAPRSGPSPTPTNPLLSLLPPDQKAAQSLLATLHVLYPHEFIPALDILDRKLVLHLLPASDGEGGVFYVRSASSGTAGTGSVDEGPGQGGMWYEVRLRAWNCTCPAFAFSALKSLPVAPVEIGMDGDGEEGRGEEFGGSLTLRDDGEGGGGGGGGAVPVCKHMLAACLARYVPGMFGGGVVRREGVEWEEMAGWAAD